MQYLTRKLSLQSKGLYLCFKYHTSLHENTAVVMTAPTQGISVASEFSLSTERAHDAGLERPLLCSLKHMMNIWHV